jgi:hypothetical protein
MVAHNQSSYSDGTLMNDGRVVFAPSDATYEGVFDPADDSFTTVVAHDWGYDAYSDATLEYDGRAIFAAFDANYVGIFDPRDDTFTAAAAHKGGESVVCGSYRNHYSTASSITPLRAPQGPRASGTKTREANAIMVQRRATVLAVGPLAPPILARAPRRSTLIRTDSEALACVVPL